MPARLTGFRAPQFVAGGSSALTILQKDDFGDRSGASHGWGDANERKGPMVPTHQANTTPEYSTFEEAEAAFIKLLRKYNVQPDWTWEQTMRATIKDTQYRALKDPKDRKAAFEKYAIDVRVQEKERAKERLAKLRQDFSKMLKSHPEIKHYTRWKTARPIIEGETIFRSTNDDTERRQLYDEYIIQLRKVNAEKEVLSRKSAMDDLVGLLKSIDLEPYTRWSEAQDMIQSHERFQADEHFKSLSKSDILTAFENHIKSLERTFNDERQREKNSRQRRERQNRDRFIDLLRELKQQGKIKAGSKWMDVHPLLSEDPRYVSILGQAGSTPLDLFWDTVEEEERSLRLLRNDVYDVLEDKRYEVTPQTTFTQFNDVMATDRRTQSLPSDIMELIFERLIEKVKKRSEEDKYASERHQRKLVDALRSKIKHLSHPSVTVSTTYESLLPRISHLEEFRALDSDELRRSAFEKVQRRLREKEEDLDHDRHSSSRRHGRRDRGGSPELDVYEAERRKAMAERERVWNKGGSGTSAGGSGSRALSPPLSARSRDHYPSSGRLRERDYDDPASHSSRRDDRLGKGRLDYRGSAGSREELDYGGTLASGGGRAGSLTGRRRRDSEGSSGGSGRKRVKRDSRGESRRTKTPEKEKEEVKEVAMHSGSEEGEMVEDE